MHSLLILIYSAIVFAGGMVAGWRMRRAIMRDRHRER